MSPPSDILWITFLPVGLSPTVEIGWRGEDRGPKTASFVLSSQEAGRLISLANSWVSEELAGVHLSIVGWTIYPRVEIPNVQALWN